LRRALDFIYATALVASAAALVSIALLVLYQIMGRILDRALVATGGEALGLQIPSLAEIGGFLFVGSAFLALPATLRSGGHIRVTMLVRNLAPLPARILTIVVLATALALAVFATWHSGLQMQDSWLFNSVSFGTVRIPLWIPQGVMTLGLALFSLALADELAYALVGKNPAFLLAQTGRGLDEGRD
jgi:TRAP-type C4-dicarboxylate transport system permease small subunit